MARTLSARIRLLALDPGKYEESCKLEWPDYSDAHPDTDKTKGQYVQECVERKENQQTRREEKRKEDEGEKPEAGAEGGGGEPPAEKSVDEMNPEERGQLVEDLQENLNVSKEDAEALADADVSPDIDPDDLNNAIDHILKEKQPDKKPWHEKLVDVTEFLMSLTDVDEFVLGLPDKAKSWADHLHKKLEENNKRQKETVEELIDHGISYEEYAKRQTAKGNPLKPPMPYREWLAIEEAKKKEDRAEETKKQLKEKKEPGSSKEDKGKDEKPKSKKDEESEKADKKPDKKKDEKKLRPRKPATQDIIDSFDPDLEDKHVDYIQGLERSRNMPDEEFMRRALAKGSPEFRRRLNDMDPKDFREFYEALWAETQP